MTSSYTKSLYFNKGLLAETRQVTLMVESQEVEWIFPEDCPSVPSILVQRQLFALAWKDWHSYRSLLCSKGRLKGSRAPNGTENRKQHMEMVFKSMDWGLLS